MKKIEFFKVEGDKINRVRKHCPKCGPGVFIAEHKDRYSCGKCGYTEFKSGSKNQSESKPKEAVEKPVEQPNAEVKEELPTYPKEPEETSEVPADEKPDKTSAEQEVSTDEPSAEQPETEEKTEEEKEENKLRKDKTTEEKKE